MNWANEQKDEGTMIVAKAIIDYEKNEYESNEMEVCLHGKATVPLEKKSIKWDYIEIIQRTYFS